MPRTEIGTQPQTLSPSEYVTADRFNQAEFANIARHEENFWWYRGIRAIQMTLLDRYLAGRKIRCALEAGCGTGYMARVLQRDRELPLVAMDYSEHGLRWGVREGLKRASQGSLLDLPFASEAFDMAMALDVLQQFAPGEERRGIAELARVLRPGGLLALRVSAFPMLRSRHSEHVLEAQRFRRGQLKRLVEAAGFRVLRATYANALLSPVALVKFRLIEPLTAKGAQSGIQPVPPWLDSLLSAALGAEAAWLRTGFDFPFGQSLLLFAEKLGRKRD